MDYMEARKRLLELAGNNHCRLSEVIPTRPCEYIKPEYSVSINLSDQVLIACGSSWKKAILSIEKELDNVRNRSEETF